MTEKKEIQIKGKQEAATPEQTRPGLVFTPAVDIFETDSGQILQAVYPVRYNRPGRHRGKTKRRRTEAAAAKGTESPAKKNRDNNIGSVLLKQKEANLKAAGRNPANRTLPAIYIKEEPMVISLQKPVFDSISIMAKTPQKKHCNMKLSKTRGNFIPHLHQPGFFVV